MGTRKGTPAGRPGPSVFRRMSRYFIPFLIVSAVFGIFLLNNFDILTEHRRDSGDSIRQEQLRRDVPSSPRESSGLSKERDIRDSGHEIARRAENVLPEADLEDFSSPDTTFVVDIPPIIFAAPGRNGVAIRVSLRILLESTEARREVLLKREEIKVIAHRLFGSPESVDMSMEALRNRLLGEINRLIESGNVDHLEFTEFRPVVRE